MAKKENCNCEKKEMKGGAVEKKEKKINAWLEHVKKYRQEHPDKPYKECLQEAKKTYKKGGVISLTPNITPNPEPEPTTEPVKKMKKVKKGGAITPSSYNPTDIKTYKQAESELMKNKASTAEIMKLYKSMKPSKYPANPKEWRDKWGMMGNYYQFLNAQNIKQKDYDRVGIDSSLKDVEEEEGGAIKKMKKVKKVKKVNFEK
jgi:hypothetical protein